MNEEIAALLAGLQDSDAFTRSSAACDLWHKADTAVTPVGNESIFFALVQALKDDEFDVRLFATMALSVLGSNLALPALLDVLLDDYSDVHSYQIIQSYAADALLKINDDSVLPELVQALEHPNEFARLGALTALGRLKQPDTVPVIIACLQDSEATVRRSAVYALQEIVHPVIIPTLLHVLAADTDWHVRSEAAIALGATGDKSLIPALGAALYDTDSRVRSEAANALVKIGDPAGYVLLIRAARDEHNTPTGGMIAALAEIGDPDAFLTLRFLLAHADSEVRYHTSEALRAIVASGKEVRNQAILMAMIDALKDSYEPMREIALFVLARLGSVAVHPLLEALEDKEALLRAGAATALGRIGAMGRMRPLDIKDTLPILARLLQCEQESSVRWQIVVTLGKIGDASAVPALIAALEDSHEPIRSRAAFILGRMGDVSAIAALQAASEDASEAVRSSAVTALEKLENLPAR